MDIDKRQLGLEPELSSRLDWYWQIREKTRKQLNFAPKSVKPLMLELIQYIDNVAMPTVRRLLSTLGYWKRTDALDFFNANQRVCELSDQINASATDEQRQTWANQSWNLT